MSTPSICNPVIGCVYTIPGGVYPERMLMFQGKITPGAQRFYINLQCGPNKDHRDDVAFHLDFRFNEMCVVRNHCIGTVWGVEERSGGMPLSGEQSFELLVLCEPQALKVTVNSVHFCEFLHRIPYQRISHFEIVGDCQMQFVDFEGLQLQAQMCLAIGRVYPIPGNMYPERMVRFQGNTTPGAQRFYINLQCGPNKYPGVDVAFHLDFRFNEMCVVRNHFIDSVWGVEESGGMPLSREQSFELLVLCEPQALKVTVNGVHFCDFVHRIPYQRITHFIIDGDCQMLFVGFEGGLVTDSDVNDCC